MTGSQIDTLTSYQLIVTEAKNKPATTALIPTFEAGINRLDDINIEISDASVQQSIDLKGITEDKQDLKQELADHVIDIAGAVYSWAQNKGDKTLMAKVNFKTTKVNGMDQKVLINAASLTREEAIKIPAEELALGGTTTDEMTQFTAALNKYKGNTSNKREAEIDRKSYTFRISELYAEAAYLKKNTLDRLATQFQRKDSEFYNKYKAAATVIHLHGRKKSSTPPPAETK